MTHIAIMLLSLVLGTLALKWLKARIPPATLKRVKWLAVGLVVANELRGIAVVVAIGPPIFRAMLS